MEDHEIDEIKTLIEKLENLALELDGAASFSDTDDETEFTSDVFYTIEDLISDIQNRIEELREIGFIENVN